MIEAERCSWLTYSVTDADQDALRIEQQGGELRDVGVRQVLCQTGCGDMSNQQNLLSMRCCAEQVMPAFQD